LAFWDGENFQLILGDLIYSENRTGAGSGTEIFTFNGESLTEGSTFTAGAATFQINYAVGDPSITLTSVVPEPSTWFMLISGLGLLALMQRRQTRTSAYYRNSGSQELYGMSVKSNDSRGCRTPKDLANRKILKIKPL